MRGLLMAFVLVFFLLTSVVLYGETKFLYKEDGGSIITYLKNSTTVNNQKKIIDTTIKIEYSTSDLIKTKRNIMQNAYKSDYEDKVAEILRDLDYQEIHILFNYERPLIKFASISLFNKKCHRNISLRLIHKDI